MTLQSQTQPIMEHILQVVFALPSDSPLQKMLSYNMYVTPEDFIMESDAILDSLEYPDDSGVSYLQYPLKLTAYSSHSSSLWQTRIAKRTQFDKNY